MLISAVTQSPTEQHLATLPPHTPSCQTRGTSERTPPKLTTMVALFFLGHFLFFSIPPQVFLCFLPPFLASPSLGNENPFLCPYVSLHRSPSPLSACAPTSSPDCPLTPFISICPLHSPCPDLSPPPPIRSPPLSPVAPLGCFPGGRVLKALLVGHSEQGNSVQLLNWAMKIILLNVACTFSQQSDS